MTHLHWWQEVPEMMWNGSNPCKKKKKRINATPSLVARGIGCNQGKADYNCLKAESASDHWVFHPSAHGCHAVVRLKMCQLL